MATKKSNSNKKNVSSAKKETKNVTTKKSNVENLTDEQILNTNFDEVNIYDLLDKNKSLKPKLKTSNGTKEKMYKDDAKKENESDKNFRRRIRNKRNSFIENILSLYQNKNEKELKETIKKFNSFYKETYTKNDFEIASICRLNSDKNTLAKVKLMFHIIKLNK